MNALVGVRSLLGGGEKLIKLFRARYAVTIVAAS
jgi:hypothetical protein